MYAKPSAGGLLAITGAAAMPTVTPALRVAKVLLEITGTGFFLYLVAAFGLFLAGVWLRWRDRVARRRMTASGP